MPRANRYFLSGHVWHLTHRCHKQEFLLKFSTDRTNWIYWLFEAKKRYGLHVLNYIVTSNHIHALVYSSEDKKIIPNSLQLIVGRTAQEYNQRKSRKGAFWEDRYHATVVETDEHLLQCLMYIDLNMVRARVVDHPKDWPHSGYHEIVSPPKRYRIIDRVKLLELLDSREERTLTRDYPEWVNEALGGQSKEREQKWTESIAVGCRSFVEGIKEKLGVRAVGRNMEEHHGSMILREPHNQYANSDISTYTGHSVSQHDNMFPWS